MTLQEKIEKWKTTQFYAWYNTRREVELDLSDRQGMWCCCGKLASGLHESHCRKFQKKVYAETIKRLEGGEK